jgi:hypothetical protein
MNKNFKIVKKQLKKFYEQHFEKIIEINEKYATPRIEMSPIVRICLMVLRFYLIILIVLLVYKFISQQTY